MELEIEDAGIKIDVGISDNGGSPPLEVFIAGPPHVTDPFQLARLLFEHPDAEDAISSARIVWQADAEKELQKERECMNGSQKG
jgi:hypothetical protein